MENLNWPEQKTAAPAGDNSTVVKPKTAEISDIVLMDYLGIIFRRKITIIAIVALVTAAAIIYNLFIPPTYEARAIIFIGNYKNKPIESINEIISIFNSDEYLKRIAIALSLPEKIDYSSVKKIFTIEKDKRADFLVIRARGKTPEIAVSNTNAIAEIVVDRHNKLFAIASKTFEGELNIIKKNREKILTDIKTLGVALIRVEKDINKYEAEILKKNDAQSEAQGRMAQSYINLVASLKNEKEATFFEISGLNLALSQNDQEMQQKEFEKQYETKPTKIEIAPIAPKEKIAPNRRKNVIASFSFALVLAVLSAFSVEYYQKFKYKLKSA